MILLSSHHSLPSLCLTFSLSPIFIICMNYEQKDLSSIIKKYSMNSQSFYEIIILKCFPHPLQNPFIHYPLFPPKFHVYILGPWVFSIRNSKFKNKDESSKEIQYISFQISFLCSVSIACTCAYAVCLLQYWPPEFWLLLYMTVCLFVLCTL